MADEFTGATIGHAKRLLSHGLRQITRPLGTRPVDPAEGVRALNRLQKFLCDETRPASRSCRMSVSPV